MTRTVNKKRDPKIPFFICSADQKTGMPLSMEGIQVEKAGT